MIIFLVTGKGIFPTLKSGNPARTHSGIVLDQDFKWKIYLNTTVHLLTYYQFYSFKDCCEYISFH